jgi:hypothetical protein
MEAMSKIVLKMIRIVFNMASREDLWRRKLETVYPIRERQRR